VGRGARCDPGRCDAMRCGMKMLSKKPVCSPMTCNIWREGTPATCFFLLFLLLLHSEPSCLSCLLISMYSHQLGSPLRVTPLDSRRRGQAAWALGSVRMRPWHAMVCLLIPGGQFNDMSSGATSPRYSRDVKLYAQGSSPFVLDDDDPRRHFGKVRSTVSAFFGGKPTYGSEVSLSVARLSRLVGSHTAADVPS
jgi:hypothetical protein